MILYLKIQDSEKKTQIWLAKEKQIRYKWRPPFRSDAGKPFTTHTDMSKHSTLKATGTVGGKRSVLKRFERVKLMKERGQWKQGQSPIGLPKTKFEA